MWNYIKEIRNVFKFSLLYTFSVKVSTVNWPHFLIASSFLAFKVSKVGNFYPNKTFKIDFFKCKYSLKGKSEKKFSSSNNIFQFVEIKRNFNYHIKRRFFFLFLKKTSVLSGLYWKIYQTICDEHFLIFNVSTLNYVICVFA